MTRKNEAIKSESTELTAKTEGQLTGMDASSMFEGDAGAGFENTTMDDYAVPFLMVLQKLSPQCDEDKPMEFVQGARPGMFYNTATGDLYESIRIVPCSYQRMFAEWIPREKGGGFRGHHLPESAEVVKATSRRDERGRFLTDRDTHLMDTRYHFVLLINGKTPCPAVIALSSTQIKKSRLWMAMMRKIEMTTPDGRSFNPPMFSHIYKISTVSESNDQGTWKGIKVEIERPLSNAEYPIYAAAKAFRKEIEAGRVKVDDSQIDSQEKSNDDEVPF